MNRYLIIVLAVMCCICGVLWRKNRKMQQENGRLQNNIEYYSSLTESNRVLRNTVSELENTRDSLILKINRVREELELKPKEMKTVIYMETTVHDTLTDTVTKDRDFETVIRPNSLTSITVRRQDTELTVIPDIRNDQVLFVQSRKRWKYRGFFRRLAHLCWKKTTYETYHIDNSNPLIRVGNTRVIEVTDGRQ